MPDFCGLAAGKKNNFFNMHFHLLEPHNHKAKQKRKEINPKTSWKTPTTKQRQTQREPIQRQVGEPQPQSITKPKENQPKDKWPHKASFQ
jgi:hypothetical protein